MADAPQIHRAKINKATNISVSFLNGLDSGELLTGTPVVTQVSAGSPQELTISNEIVNTSALTINGLSNAAGQAVQFAVTGSVAGLYKLDVYCATDATPSQDRGGRILFEVYA